VHDKIRGEGSYLKTRQNILDYIAAPNRHNKPAWKDIWITMTINSLNYDSVEDLTEEWIGKVNKIGFQFHIVVILYFLFTPIAYRKMQD
jgi:Fe-coproporphyrin III synthase